MHGSQLIAVETHQKKKLVTGVSDPKVHAESLVAAESSPKPTPPTPTGMMSSNVTMPLTSKKTSMAEKGKSGTSG